MNFGSFMDNAKRIAEIAKQQMPAHERKATGKKERVLGDPLREMTTPEVKAGEAASCLKNHLYSSLNHQIKPAATEYRASAIPLSHHIQTMKWPLSCSN